MKKDVYEIVLKSLKGLELDTKESAMIDSFLCEEGNYILYQSLKKVYSKSKDLEGVPEMDVDRAFTRHLGIRGDKKIEENRPWISSFVRYAAVFILLMSVSLVMFWEYGIDDKLSISSNMVAGVVPGSNKAELIMANGVHVDLSQTAEAIKDIDGADIVNTGEELIYKAVDKATDKAVNKELSYNSLLIPRGGEYRLTLSDGTFVVMNSESKLRYPTAFSDDKRVVFLEGEGYFEVKKDKSRPFIVRTSGVDIKVLGTSFNVSSYEGENDIKTTLVEGSVEVISGDKSVIIKPGYQSSYDRKNCKLKRPKKVNLELFTSWIDGRFVFENARLEDLMNSLSRWYDIEVFYMNEDAKDIAFTGGVKRYNNLDDLLHLIEKTNYVSFSKKGKNIIVRKKYKK